MARAEEVDAPRADDGLDKGAAVPVGSGGKEALRAVAQLVRRKEAKFAQRLAVEHEAEPYVSAAAERVAPGRAALRSARRSQAEYTGTKPSRRRRRPCPCCSPPQGGVQSPAGRSVSPSAARARGEWTAAPPRRRRPCRALCRRKRPPCVRPRRAGRSRRPSDAAEHHASPRVKAESIVFKISFIALSFIKNGFWVL